MSEPKKRKGGGPRGRRGKKTKIDPVAVQVSISAPVIRNKRGKEIPIQPEVLQQAILVWADTGEPPPGFWIEGVEWENYGRNKERRYARTEEEIEEARLTLKLGQMFRGKHLRLSPIRKSERAS